MLGAIIGYIKSFFVKKEEVESISTFIMAGGTMISILVWLFLITILIKVFNSAFTGTEQQDSIDDVKNLINQKQREKNR